MRTLIIMMLLFSSYGSPMSAQEQNATISLEYTFNFETAESQLPSPLLQQVVQKAVAWQQHKVILQGHTDASGSEQSNQTLSEKRVQYIKQLLIKAGLPNERIQTKAWGEKHPIADNNSDKGKSLNRRVEILLTNRTDWEQDHQALLTKKLKSLLQPSKNEFILKSHKAQTIIATKGTQIHIPDNAFDVPNGTVVTLQVVEVFEPSDMILYNLQTTSNNQQLTTGGMIKIDAFAAGKAVPLKAGKSLSIHVPSDNPNPEMQLFESETIGDRINWINPQPLTMAEMPSVNESPDSLQRYPILGGSAPGDNLGMPDFYNTRTPLFSEHYKFNPSPYYEPIPFEPQRKDYYTAQELALDSLVLNKLLARKDDAQNNPWRGFIPYRKKPFLFWKIKVKKNATDSAKFQQSLANRIARWEAQITTEKKRLESEKILRDKYFAKIEAYKVEHNFWQQQRDSVLDLNLNRALARKDRTGIQRYSHHLTPKDRVLIWAPFFNIYNYNQLRSVLGKAPNYQDSLICHMACANNDTSAILLMHTEPYALKLLMCIYNLDTEEEAYAKHLDIQEYNYYRKIAQKLGVETIAEAKVIIKQQQEHQKQLNSYNLKMGKLGHFINCDFFSQFPKEDLIIAKQQLKHPFSQVKTYILFEKFNSLMMAYALGSRQNLVPNSCYFHHIPKGQPVKIISFYLEANGNIQLAIKRTTVQGNMPSLTYKSMNEKAFLVALTALNT